MYMSEKLPKMKKTCRMVKMRDRAEGYRVKKGNLPDLPMKLMIIGPSQVAGKTNNIGNLLLRPWDEKDTEGLAFYMKNFIGENIYIVCPSTVIDSKWNDIIEGKKVPGGHIYTSYDEQELDTLYTKLEKECLDKIENKELPPHICIIFDDCSFDGKLKGKMNGILAKFFMNGRHFLFSSIVTAQSYIDVPPSCRKNATAMMLYNCAYSQMESIYQDIGDRPKKDFIKMFRNTTQEPHSFLAFNLLKRSSERFMDTFWDPLEPYVDK